MKEAVYSRFFRRGGIPADPRLRRGVTLVELMVAMLILAIVCVAWLEIIGIQSARREARRREAVERLAGMMDAFMYLKGASEESVDPSYGYVMVTNGTKLSFDRDKVRGATTVYPVFPTDVSPIGYQLCVVNKDAILSSEVVADWTYPGEGRKVSPGRWLIGRLYDSYGSLGDVGKPFFTLPVCLGF